MNNKLTPDDFPVDVIKSLNNSSGKDLVTLEDHNNIVKRLLAIINDQDEQIYRLEHLQGYT